jgi:hypothetical protein
MQSRWKCVNGVFAMICSVDASLALGDEIVISDVDRGAAKMTVVITAME